MSDDAPLTALGTARAAFTALETFPRPEGLRHVALVCDEVTANCPVTGQPDWYTVQITYQPGERCVESKTVKLYLQSFRDAGMFCEAFACRIARDFAAVLGVEVGVQVRQKSRGGVVIEAFARECPVVQP